MNKNTSILEMDFNKLDQRMSDWYQLREQKIKIYKAYSEYIECLKNTLKHEANLYKKLLIANEIKKLESAQKKFYVPSMLEMCSYSKINSIRVKKIN